MPAPGKGLFAGLPIEALRRMGPVAQSTFMETLFRVKDPSTGGMVPLKFNPMQMDVLTRTSPNEILVKSRRAGATTANVARALLRMLLYPGTTVELFAHNEATARAIFEEIVTPMWYSIPREIRPEADSKTANLLRMRRHGSYFQVRTAGQSQHVARNQGQARTISILILTEFAFYAYPEELYLGLENCVPVGRGSIWIDSTPNGLNAFNYRYLAAKGGHDKYTHRFYPWWWDIKNARRFEDDTDIPRHPYTEDELRLGEDNPYNKNGLHEYQIAWRRWKILNTKPLGSLSSQDRFLVEFPENDRSCFLASGRPVFLPDDCEVRTDAREAIKGHWHGIGHDSSTGAAHGHPAGISIIDLDTNPAQQVYEWRGWEPVEVQAIHLLELQKRYPGTIIPERNGPGVAVIAMLRQRDVDYLYYHRDVDMREGTMAVDVQKPGFPMSASSKPRVFNELQAALTTHKQTRKPELMLCGSNTCEDLRGFQYDDTDKIEFVGPPNMGDNITHGDLGIALCLAWEARKRNAGGVV